MTNALPKTDQEIVARMIELREIATSGNAEMFERMAKNMRYKSGAGSGQWDPAVKQYNESRGKCCITIPLIRPQVQFLAGQVAQNPKDITMINHHGGMKMLADIKSALIKHAMSDQSAQYEISHAFENGISCGAGYVGVFVDRSRDPLYGDLEIRQLDPFDVMPDPTCKVYDPNTRGEGGMFVIWQPWADREELKLLYPDKANLIDSQGNGSLGGSGGIVSYIRNFMSGVLGIHHNSMVSSSGEMIGEDFNDLKTRLFHCWYRTPRNVWYVYDTEDESKPPTFVVEESDKRGLEKEVKQFGSRYVIKDAVCQVMHHATMIGDALLDHKVDEMEMLTGGMSLFPIMGFYPYFDSGYKSTIVDDLIGAQDYVNYMKSAETNIIKGQANRGWIIASDEHGKAQWLSDHGSEDGVVIHADWFGGKVEKLLPAPIGVAHEAAYQDGKLVMREITNIRTESPEADPKQLSGRAIGLKQQASATGTFSVLQRWDWTFHMLGTYLSTVISSTKVYSDYEIAQIIDEKNLINPALMDEARVAATQSLGVELPVAPLDFNKAQIMQLDPVMRENTIKDMEKVQAMQQQAMAEVDKLAKEMVIKSTIAALRNVRSGRYYASVGTSRSAPSARFQQFAETLDLNTALRESGLPSLPPKTLIEASDVPHKEELLKEMESQQAAMAGAGATA